MVGEVFSFYLDRGSYDLCVTCRVRHLLVGHPPIRPTFNTQTAALVDPGEPEASPEVELDLLDENGNDISDLITAEEDDWIQRKVLQKLGEQ